MCSAVPPCPNGWVEAATTGPIGRHGLDDRTAALAGLAALLALRASGKAYHDCVDRALAAGASVDDVIDTLKVVAPAVGLARLVSAASDVALALGYDIDGALEALDIPRPDSPDGF
jgi:alkylhydroperoxidase/carboxymuconolactone decarboxylase family protein YurZ